MTIKITRQLNDATGAPITGATVEVFESGSNTLVSSHTTDSEGMIDLDLTDDGTLYDIKFTFSGTIWWIRGSLAGQMEELEVNKVFRFPRYTTAQRDAISGLGASDKGFAIYNTTLNRLETWAGGAWVGPSPTAKDITVSTADPSGNAC